MSCCVAGRSAGAALAGGGAEAAAAGRRRPARQEERAAEHDHHRHRRLHVGRRDEPHLDVDVDRRERRVVDVARQLLHDDRHAAERVVRRRRHLPRDLRHVLRHAAEHFAIEVLDDLRAALASSTSPPIVTFLPFFSVSTSGRSGYGIGGRLVVVGVVGRLLVAARARAQLRDAELLHHVLVVFRGSPRLRHRHAGRDLGGIDRLGRRGLELRVRRRTGWRAPRPGAACGASWGGSVS